MVLFVPFFFRIHIDHSGHPVGWYYHLIVIFNLHEHHFRRRSIALTFVGHRYPHPPHAGLRRADPHPGADIPR